jgi:threonine dehydratase
MYAARVHLKLENLQDTGSFKIRGATHKLISAGADIGSAGVVAASAGNHAQGVALAAKRAGMPATVVMPEWVSITKQEATRAYGGRVVIRGAGIEESLEHARQLARQAGMCLIHPFNDPDILAGQGSIGFEILEDLADVDTLLVPIGGGGLVSGVAAVVKSIRPETRVIGVQAAVCPSAVQALDAGKSIPIDASPSIADGISVKQVGDITFSYIHRFVDEVVVVAEETIATAMLTLLERKKMLVEGSGAAPLAALMSGAVVLEKGESVVLLISGGNVDTPLLGRIVSHGLIRHGRIMRIRVVLPDIPGSLACLLAEVAHSKANVLHIHHDRNLVNLPINETAVALELETRSTAHAEQVTRDLQAAGYTVEPGRWL